MTFKEFIRFFYGLAMGTSTPFLKPSKRFLFQAGLHKVDDSLSLVMGGSAVCGLLRSEKGVLLINTNQGAAAGLLKREIGGRSVMLVLSSLATDFSAGIGALEDVEKVLVAGSDSDLRQVPESLRGKFERVTEERVFEWGDERVHLVPMGTAATSSDLVVVLENRSMVFAGALFYNRLQPVLRAGAGLNPAAWIAGLEGLLSRFKPKAIVPGEGDVGSLQDVNEFLDYLRALTNPAVEFRECRARYDWPEIPSYTSLEENFDLLRSKEKSHTTLGS